MMRRLYEWIARRLCDHTYAIPIKRHGNGLFCPECGRVIR